MYRFLPYRIPYVRAATSIWPVSAVLSWRQTEAQDRAPRFDKRITDPRQKTIDCLNLDTERLQKFYFTFGPNNSYFYRDPNGSTWSMPTQHVKPLLEDADTTVDWIVWDSANLYIQHTNSEDTNRLTNGAIQTNMPEMCSLMDAYRDEAPYVVLGPDNSYLFWCKKSTHWAYSVSKTISNEIGNLIKRKNLSVVALGHSSAYYLKYEDGSAAWDLRGAYPALAIKLDAIEHSGDLEVHYLAMDASQPNHYFLLLSNGSVAFHLDESMLQRIKKRLEAGGVVIRGHNC